jgi:hypothetical protein
VLLYVNEVEERNGAVSDCRRRNDGFKSTETRSTLCVYYNRQKAISAVLVNACSCLYLAGQNGFICRSRVTYCRPKQSYKLSNVQQIDFPRVFHMWSCIQSVVIWREPGEQD